jgi:hypothetical protein
LGLTATVLTIAGAFLLGLTVGALVAAVDLGTGFLGLGRLPGGCHVWGLGSLCDRLRSWSVNWGRSVGFDNSPPSDDVAPPLAKVHLLGRGSGPRSFRGGRVASGGALTTLLERPLCKSRLRFFPLYTATVVRRVIFPATTALRLSPRGRASTGEVGIPTREAPGCISAVTLRVPEAPAAFTLQSLLWPHVRLQRHSQTAELGDRSDLGHLRAPRH